VGELEDGEFLKVVEMQDRYVAVLLQEDGIPSAMAV